jgi:hypothetical protein
VEFRGQAYTDFAKTKIFFWGIFDPMMFKSSTFLTASLLAIYFPAIWVLFQANSHRYDVRLPVERIIIQQAL